MFNNEFEKYAIKHININSLFLNKYISSFNFNIKNITPYITEERKLNVVQMDVFSRLMMERIIFIGTIINSQVANIIQAQLLFLQYINSSEIRIYINSPGGDVYSGFGIYDTMQMVEPIISTTCTGIAASMAAILLCAGNKGKRYCLKHSRIMIHQPIGEVKGQASDIEITAIEIKKIRKELYKILSKHTGQSFEKISKDSDRDYWMESKEALEYGMIDKILGDKILGSKKKKLKK
ncbi:ATP-dependent Clp protease proteolytic subunit [Candidatus Shikimatogenerans silvanidophilus]|uniref:ATP-dependent Clp protease proteolytic subunit n=1 Tax=Candidatus Shikimatogenerans silvanidophilus TaxID=2782547 RepID=UPI001BA7DA5D|nr:ATP-dependent Clp protease proteolytic subunit [Candidatus Shikimatogenerans silvanidophilus]